MDTSLLFGLLTSGAGVFFGKGRKGGSADAWQAAADTWNLHYKPATIWTGPKLTGYISANYLTVDIKDRNTASAATRFHLGMPSLNLGLKLTKRGFWNGLGPRTLTGDHIFDSQVVAQGLHATALKEFLTPERRRAVQSFLTSFKGGKITDNEIMFRTRGLVKSRDEMLGAIDAVLQVASVLTSEPAMAAVAQSETAPAASVAPADSAEVVAPEPEPAPDLETEVDLAQANEPEQLAEAEPEATPPSEPPAAVNGSPGIDEFCSTVFAPGALSFAANQKFKESFKGERVSWSGTLESATPYSFDFDFGSGGGIKAILTILKSQGVGSRDVQAVLGLPPDIAGLEEKIGQRVEFTGRLLKVDGLAKRVVVTEAELRP